MGRRWTIRVECDADLVTVRGWRAGDLLQAGGFRPTWLGTRQAWVLDAKHAGDVLAVLEYSGAALLVVGQSIQRAEVPGADLGVQEQPALFDALGVSTVDIPGGDAA